MIDQDYINSIFKRLSAMEVELDSNPLEFGPSALNEKVAEARGHLTATERIFMEVSHNLHKYKRDLLVAESAFRISVTRLMAEDPHVRQGRSQGEREALASMRLTDDQDKIDELKLAVNDLEDLIKVIKAKRTDLKDLQGRIRDQLKLCQEQIGLGQRWGGKSVPQRPDLIPQEDMDLNSVFADALKGSIAEDEVSTDDIDGFMESDVESESATEDLDLSDILDSI